MTYWVSCCHIYILKPSKEFSFWITLNKNKPTFVCTKDSHFSPQSPTLKLWEAQDLSPLSSVPPGTKWKPPEHTLLAVMGKEERGSALGGILVWRALMCSSVYFFNPLFPPVPTVQFHGPLKGSTGSSHWMALSDLNGEGRWVLTAHAWLRPIHKGRKPDRPGPKPLRVIKPMRFYMSSEQSWTEVQVLRGGGDTVSWCMSSQETHLTAAV